MLGMLFFRNTVTVLRADVHKNSLGNANFVCRKTIPTYICLGTKLPIDFETV